MLFLSFSYRKSASKTFLVDTGAVGTSIVEILNSARGNFNSHLPPMLMVELVGFWPFDSFNAFSLLFQKKLRCVNPLILVNNAVMPAEFWLYNSNSDFFLPAVP